MGNMKVKNHIENWILLGMSYISIEQILVLVLISFNDKFVIY